MVATSLLAKATALCICDLDEVGKIPPRQRNCLRIITPSPPAGLSAAVRPRNCGRSVAAAISYRARKQHAVWATVPNTPAASIKAKRDVTRTLDRGLDDSGVARSVSRSARCADAVA